MRKSTIVVVALAIMLFPPLCAAKSAARVTVAISVYLSAAPQSKAKLVSAADTACSSTATVKIGSSGATQCQSQSTLYTWHQTASGTTLVVAPV